MSIRGFLRNLFMDDPTRKRAPRQHGDDLADEIRDTLGASGNSGRWISTTTWRYLEDRDRSHDPKPGR